jgi:ATP phosphoribosyltransferase
MSATVRLRIAVQKSGPLTDFSLDLLSRCGLKYSRGKDQLMCYGENMPLDVLFVRDDAIPDLVQADVCDLGVVGLDLIEEKRLSFLARSIVRLFETVRTLDFGRCRLCIAVPDRFDYSPASARSRESASPVGR